MALGLLSTQEAGEQLGVSARRVRALVEQGDLDAVRAGRTLLVSPESVGRHQARGAGTTRPLSERMSWAAMLSDIGTTDVERVTRALGLSSSEHQRLLRLGDRPTSDWSWLARRRARTERYAVRGIYLADIVTTAGVLVSGISALHRYDVDLTTRGGAAEIYTGATEREALAREFMMRPDAPGNLIVHVLPEIDKMTRLLEGRTEMTATTVAVDLLESGEPRARRAGLELVETILARRGQ
jgi:excisionase family DNA binding protein